MHSGKELLVVKMFVDGNCSQNANEKWVKKEEVLVGFQHTYIVDCSFKLTQMSAFCSQCGLFFMHELRCDK